MIIADLFDARIWALLPQFNRLRIIRHTLKFDNLTALINKDDIIRLTDTHGMQ